MKRLSVFVMLLSLLGVQQVFANTNPNPVLEKRTLAQIVTLLNRITPLVTQAQQFQDPTARVQFQFTALQQDINNMKAGINQALDVNNVTLLTPQQVTPIEGHYLTVAGHSVPTGTFAHDDP